MIYTFINRWKTPDGTILESKYNWDYQTHDDEVSGEWYMCDGLGYMIRTSANEVKMQDLCVTSDDPFEVQRSQVTWGSYGKNGDQPRKANIIKDMSDDHISAILMTQKQLKGTAYEALFLKEQLYRKEHGIFIKD